MIISYLLFRQARRAEDRPWAESVLEGGALPLSALEARLDGRRVAIVGNAQAAMSDAQGAEIDGHDIVIRINSAPGLGQPGRGAKIDWLATSIPPALRHDALDVVLWMSNKRRRLTYRQWRSGRVALYPAARNRALRKTLGARPSTGIMVIDLLLASPAGSVTVFGFDFFHSASLSGHANMAAVPHDFAAEGVWARAAAEADPRLTIRPPDGDTRP